VRHKVLPQLLGAHTHAACYGLTLVPSWT
jgi:hypothetical protein